MAKNKNDYFIRPTYKKFGVYERTGINRAKVIFEGSKDECYAKLKEIHKEIRNEI